jgi:hypothetical protein
MKEKESIMMDTIVSTRMGKCASCWNKGSPATLVSAPPMSRCVDYRTCEARRRGNVTGHHMVTKLATVETVRRHRVHYFRVVRKYIKDEQGVERLVREDLELVPARQRATKFEPRLANMIAKSWNGIAREV